MSARPPDPLGTPGLERVLTRWLLPAYAIGVTLPWVVGAWIKTGYQPGLVPGDPQPTRDLIDIVCMGVTLFDATLVFTVAIGCLVVTVMKGPMHRGDSSHATRHGQDDERPRL
ncbi:hypothetical protein [Thiomonas sp.]|jgi:hypothetical protein|uniref:hypothetical protein n=1 Tax=Thiomonas sp. TaxID=2047785 RepID=UPI002617A3BA|nr:hypothetical protein [Thiomonas sp.]